MYLDAKRTANVLANHANAGLWQVKLPCIQILHHVRSLLRVVDRQLARRRVVVGNLATWLQRDSRMPTEVESSLGYDVSTRESLVDTPGVQRAGEAQVVSQLWVDHRGVRVKSGLHVHRSGQVLPGNLNVLQGIFSFGPGFSHHSHHRLALPTGAVHRHGVLGCRFDAGEMA